LNQNDAKDSHYQGTFHFFKISKDAEKDFNASEADWGFREFSKIKKKTKEIVPLEKLYTYEEGFFKNNSIIFDFILQVGKEVEKE
jgi:hypothetical protein